MGSSTALIAIITVAFLLLSEILIKITKKRWLRKGTIPMLWTLLVVTLTIYPVAELTRFIGSFYGVFGYWGFLAEFGLMFLGYVAGIIIVFGLALKKL